MVWVSVLLAAAVCAVVVGGLINRRATNKGIGWQFIRYTVLSTAVPVVCLLALNDSLSAEAATLIAGAMGYAFGKVGEKGTAED